MEDHSMTHEDINKGVQAFKSLAELPQDADGKDIWKAYSEATAFMDTLNSKDVSVMQAFSQSLLENGVVTISQTQ
jgi:hypothetical protein